MSHLQMACPLQKSEHAAKERSAVIGGSGDCRGMI
jgi:hypothetical protein